MHVHVWQHGVKQRIVFCCMKEIPENVVSHTIRIVHVLYYIEENEDVRTWLVNNDITYSTDLVCLVSNSIRTLGRLVDWLVVARVHTYTA